MKDKIYTLLEKLILLLLIISCSSGLEDDSTGGSNINSPIIEMKSLNVIVFPSGTGSTTPMSGEYEINESLKILANPDSGYVFDHWEGDLTGSNNPADLIMEQDKVIVAYFLDESLIQYDLTSDVTPIGSGTISPAMGEYSNGSNITVTATPNIGYIFLQWEGDLSGYVNPVDLTMDSDKDITAVFVEQEYFLITDVTGDGGAGDISRWPYDIKYGAGAEVELEAESSSSLIEFDHWEGDLTGSTNPVTVTMDEDKYIIAVYEVVFPF